MFLLVVALVVKWDLGTKKLEKGTTQCRGELLYRYTNIYGFGRLIGPSGALISVASYVGVKIRFEGGWRHPKQQFWHCAAAGFENKLVEDSFWT